MEKNVAETEKRTQQQVKLDEEFLNSLWIEREAAKIREYLEMGADPNAQEGKALEKLICLEYLDGVKVLLEYGAIITSYHMMMAVEKSLYDIVEIMISKGAKPSGSCLFKTVINRDEKMVALLVKHGAEITSETVKKALGNSLRIVNILLERWGGHFPSSVNLFGEGVECEYDVAKFILDEKNYEIIEAVVEKCHQQGGEFFTEFTFATLQNGIRGAKLNLVRLALEYMQRESFSYAANKKTLQKNALMLAKNAKSSKELNDILLFLKTYGHLQKFLIFDNEGGVDSSIHELCRVAIAETFKIVGEEMRQEHMGFAIRYANVELVKSLIDIGMKPTDDDVLLAYVQAADSAFHDSAENKILSELKTVVDTEEQRMMVEYLG